MKILALAYACEPGKGSEPGAGWAWVRILARLGETWVLTRENNRSAIEKARRELPEGHHLHFEYVDLPKAWRWWKRGNRGVRLYYLLWQAAALRRAKQLQRRTSFDFVWHLTLANAWLGSVGALVGTPFIYGPVGGGVRTPIRLWPAVGLRGCLFEGTRSLVRALCRYLNPLARVAWRRADLILAQNHETRAWFPVNHRSRVHVLQNAVIESDATQTEASGMRNETALFVARLVPWKGVAIAIRAIAKVPDWTLIVLGEGRDEHRLRRLAVRLGVADRVDFRGSRPRNEVLRTMRTEASLLLFPSLHDDAGLVVAEAVANQLPVVCLDVGGPAIIAGSAGVVISTTRRTLHQLSTTLAQTLKDGRRPSRQAVKARSRELTLESRASDVRRLLNVAGVMQTGGGRQ